VAATRPALLRRLLGSLQEGGPPRKLIVVDNGFSAETEALCREQPFPVLYHRPERNLGCGGGIGRGISLGLEDPAIDYFCCLDDDAEATPGALEALIGGMIAAGAVVAVPLVTDSEGLVSWTPGILDRRVRQTLRCGRMTPDQYRAAFGLDPVPFSWAPGMALAFSARIVRELGLPRADFWLCGEDLEYTLRLNYRHRGVMVPAAVCRHLPLPGTGDDYVGSPHYLHCFLMLQNISYISTRLPHGRRIFRHLPGNFRRVLRLFNYSPAALRDAWLAWWRGAVRGKPAGTPGFDGFKNRMLQAGSRSAPAAKGAETPG
jgi:GT2 family glycosyltransferase